MSLSRLGFSIINLILARDGEDPMGQVVTVMNMKGGVGKTTVCLHIGGLLGRSDFNKKVLLIDYDPQFNLSQALLRPKKYFELEERHKTCLRILQDPDSELDPFVIQTPASAYLQLRICQRGYFPAGQAVPSHGEELNVFVVDTNILLYAAVSEFAEHDRARSAVAEWRRGSEA